ncbi:MAG: hypothetical protein ABFD25_18060 [Clostridiaceae bacterium]
MVDMKEWLSGSIVYSLFYRLFELLKRFAGIISDGFSRLNQHSVVYRLYKWLVNDKDKSTNMKKSGFFKAASSFGRLLKKAASKLNGFFGMQARSSIFWMLIKDMDRGFCENPYVLSGLLAAGFFTSYTLAVLIRGNIGKMSLAIMAVLFIAAAVLLLLRGKIKDIICASVSYRLIKMIIK